MVRIFGRKLIDSVRGRDLIPEQIKIRTTDRTNLKRLWAPLLENFPPHGHPSIFDPIPGPNRINEKLNFVQVKLKPYHRANSSQPSEHDSSISSLDSPMFKSSSHFGSEFKDGEVEILNPTNQIVQTDICSS